MRRSPLFVVYLTVFLDIFGFGIVLPSLPFFVIDRVGQNGAWVGGLVASYSLAQFVGAAFLGRASDRFGRRPILIFSLLGSALALTATALADTLWGMLIARAIAGLCAGSIATAQAYIADVTEEKERAKYMGMLGAAIGTGFVFGPAAGSVIGRYGFQAAALFAAVLAFANMLLAIAVLRESLPKDARTPKDRPRFNVSEIQRAFSQPGASLVLWASFLCMLGFVAMETTFPLLGKQNAGLGPRELGLVFSFVGIMMVIVQGGLIGRLTKRFGERTLSMAGCAAMGIALVAMPFAHGLGELFGTVGVLAFGSGLATPSMSTLLSRMTPQDEQGGVMGINQSLGALARALGPMAAGPLYDIHPLVTYGAGGVLMFVSLAFLLPVSQPQNRGPLGVPAEVSP